MSTLLRGATLVELEPPLVERADLRIDKGKIIARGPSLAVEPGEDVTELAGRVVLPGFVSAHHHLHSGFLRGFGKQYGGFDAARGMLSRLETHLSLDEIELAGTIGAMEGLAAGTTTVFALHASPGAVTGALQRLSQGLNTAGIRAVIGYEWSERDEAGTREAAFEEATWFLKKSRGRLRGAIGLTGLSALSDDVLQAVKSLAVQTEAHVMLNVAEDVHEEFRSVSAFGSTPLERLFGLDLIGERTLLAQGVHFSWPQLSDLLSRGAWLVHTPRSNMNTQTGLATALKFGQRGCLGTDIMTLDVFAEAQMASLRSADAGQPIDCLRFIANGHRVASQIFGQTIGPLRESAVADLLVLDYQPTTPLTADTLPHHLLQGMASHHVESVMVDGMWRTWRRKPLSVDTVELARASREAVQGLWAKMATHG